MKLPGTTRRRLPKVLVASLFLSLFAGLASSATGCLAIVDTRTSQCDTNDDCVALGAAFTGTVCGADHVCGTPPQCTTNKECTAQLGDTAVCNQVTYQCALVKSAQCQTILGDVTDITDAPFVFIIGAINPLSGTDQSIGVPVQNGAEIARREIMQTTNGIQPVAKEPPIPIVIVSCDEADAVGAADHLVNDLGVQAIIGPQFSDDVVAVATQVTIPGSAMLISPTATASSISTLNDSSLVWRTSPPDKYQAAALEAYLANTLEPQIRSQRMLPASQKLKVAILFKGDTYGTGFSTLLAANLMVNGEQISTDTTNYLAKDYGNVGDSDDPPKYDDIVQQAVSFQPDIIIAIGTTEVVTSIFTPIEANWTATDHKPFWVLTDGAVGPDIVTAVGSSDVRQRLRGTTPGTTNARYQALLSRYNTVFGTDVPPQTYGVAGAYDAVYIFFYAALTTFVETSGTVTDDVTGLDGQDLAAQMAYIVDQSAETIDVGPDNLNDGVRAVLASSNINLDGASGSLNFHLDSGDAPSDIQVWCLDALGSNTAQQISYSGIYVSFDNNDSPIETGTDGCK